MHKLKEHIANLKAQLADIQSQLKPWLNKTAKQEVQSQLNAIVKSSDKLTKTEVNIPTELRELKFKLINELDKYKEAEELQKELVRGLESENKLAERIQNRIDAYAQMPTIPVPAPVVETFLDAATDATIIEVRSHDRPALLFSIGDTVRKCNIDIKSAIVTTLGAEAIDTLYVTEIGGGALTNERADEVSSRIQLSLK